MAGGEEKVVVRAESQGGDWLGVSVEGGPDGCVGGIDDFDGIAACTGDEGAVR